MISDAFIVLGHEILFPSHDLSDCSRARCDLLYSLVGSRAPNEYVVCFMGKGRLQGDCPFSISQCMYDYYSSTYHSLENYHIDLESLDTVGDAVYSRELLKKYPNVRNAHIVTSDWHLLRTSTIFGSVYSSSHYNISFFGTEELSLMTPEALQARALSERESLEHFKYSFREHALIKNWLESLKKNHSLYIDQ